MERPISQDIRKYKTKDVGNFSFKEAGYIALAIGAGFLCYNIFHFTLEGCILPIGIIIIFGFFKPYGMTFIQFLRTVGREKMSPVTYINETDFVYDYEELAEEYGEEFDVALTDEWLIQSQETVCNKITKSERPKILR